MYPERSGEHPSTVPSRMDRDFTLIYANDHYYTLYGLTREGYVKKELKFLLPSKKKRCRKTALRRRYRTNAAEQENPESKMPD